MTDIDGITPRITLPSPPKLYSLSPKNEKLPYSLYDIEVTKEGYYTKRIHNVALFSGTDSLQPVNMIPVAVYGNGAAFPRDTLNSTVSENPYL